jgi:hypothetical protein
MPQSGDSVALSEGLPQYDLLAGDVGVVHSVRLDPTPVCRVDFQSECTDQVIRITLSAEQVTVLERPACAGNVVEHSGDGR